MSLQDDPLIQDIKLRINNEITAVCETITGGRISTIEEYKRHIGVKIGLINALERIDESINKYSKDEDEDD